MTEHPPMPPKTDKEETNMNFGKIHPVKSGLAVIAWLSVVYFLAVGIEIPDAYWAILAAISTYYFGNRES